MERKILHLDLDAFYCAVEELRDPTLRGQAFAVGGQPSERGVVASCSYPARQRGVHSAMPMSQAVRLCPALLIVPAHHNAYADQSRQVMARLRALTPQVEQLSIDEAFLEVTDQPESGETIARRLQATIRNELALPASLGVAANKLVAKIANNVGKAAVLKAGAKETGPPCAITVVPAGGEAAFLAALPCAELWGVGPKTALRLAELGIHTIGELAAHNVKELERLFGKNGFDLAQHARGVDNRPISTQRETKSISQETTFVRDVRDGVELRRTLQEQAESVARVLRRKRFTARTVKLKLRWTDFTTATRQSTLAQPTDDPLRIYQAAEQLLALLWHDQPVRLIGVGVSGLGVEQRQMNLWDQPNEKEERLQAALTSLQSRFGTKIIQRGDRLFDPDEFSNEDSSFSQL